MGKYFSMGDLGEMVGVVADELVRERDELQARLQTLHNRPTKMPPTAPPPPQFTPETWSLTCVHRDSRCSRCDLCKWELLAESRFFQAGTYEADPSFRAPQHRPTTFRSLTDALVALVEWETHNRWSPSAMGALMDRLKQGATHGQAGTNYNREREDPSLRKATDVVEVRRALEQAFIDNVWGYQETECMAILIARVGNARADLPKYEELEERFKVPANTCRTLVRLGRRRINVELAARGVVPMPNKSLGMAWDIDVRRKELEARSV